MSVLGDLRKRKLVQWALAYAAAAWAALQVLDLLAEVYHWPEQALRVGIALASIGFLATLVLAWYHGERGQQRVARNEAALLATLFVAGGLLAWRSAQGPELPPRPTPPAPTAAAAPSAKATSTRSIAVLPFVNMSADPENEFFSDGLSEEILNSLARIEGLQVVGRTSSFQFKGRNQDLRGIGDTLGVSTVLEGSVRRDGARARIAAQLIRSRDGFHLWSQTYDRTLQDTLAVQLDIAEQVAAALDVLLDDRQRETMRKAGVANVDAFIHYQKGWSLYLAAHRDPAIDLLQGLRPANAEFDQAIALEPNYAMAHYAKADLHEHILIDDRTSPRERAQAQQAVLETLARAAAASPDAQQREFALAERQMLSDDWRGIGDRLANALAQPGCAAPNWMPVFASAFGFADALEPVLARAATCDPLNSITWNTRSWVARAAGNGARMQAIHAHLRSFQPALAPRAHEALALALLGRRESLQRRLAALDTGLASSHGLALQIARLGGLDHAEALAWAGPVTRGGNKVREWQIVDLVEAALYGTREEANRRAALLDARPAGGLLLAVAVTYCGCGAPFDLSATPNFKAHLQDSGLPWPPPAAIRYPPPRATAR